MPAVDARTLDLHGLTWNEALAAFIEFYNDAVRRSDGNVGSLEVVHGYGSAGVGGVLRTRLRGFLERHQSYLEFQSGENVDGNQGHTFVFPIKPLPPSSEQLVEEIWVYCTSAKPLSKITGRFRRHGEREVLAAVRTLQKQRRLEAVQKGVHKLHQAV